MSGQLRYRVQVYAAGVSATTGTIGFTIASSQLAGVPQMGGQRVQPLQGSVESIPWAVDVLDSSGWFTNHIASTATGRLNKLGRLVRIQCSTNSTASSAYGTLQVGRISDLAVGNPNVATYRLTISDERIIERNTMIFTKVPAANAVSLIPAGVPGGFIGWPGAGGSGWLPGLWTVLNVINNYVCLGYGSPTFRFIASDKISQAIINDLAPPGPADSAIGMAGFTSVTRGNFRYLRFHAGAIPSVGSDYEVGQFDTSSDLLPHYSYVNDMLANGLRLPFFVWIVVTSSPPTIGAQLNGFLYMPNRPPDETLPLMVGGTAGTYPFTMLGAVYGGSYSTTLPVRYSTAALAPLQTAAYGSAWWRITSPAVMADWVQEQIYKPNFAVPLLDTQGRIAPTPLAVPSTLSPATLLALSSSNLSGHPTFEQPINEAVTTVTGTIPTFQFIAGTSGNRSINPDLLQVGTFQALPSTGSYGSSALVSSNVLQLGGQSYNVQFPNTIYLGQGGGGLISPNFFALPQLYALARSIFSRLQDGPLYARQTQCLPSVDATTRGKLQPGTYVLLSLGTYPNPHTNRRGGARIMQIVSRQETPTGPRLELLDAGSTIAATAAPTVAVAQSSISSRHAVKLTVTSVPSGARWRAQLAPTTSTGATVPSAASSRWKTMLVGGSTGIFQVGNLPSHTQFYSRVDAVNLVTGAALSAWSSGGAAVTAKIIGPSSLKTTGITGSAATLKWKNGSSYYPTDVMIDTSTAAVLGTSRRVASVPARTTQFGIAPLSTGQKYKWGVRHADAYGGYSTIASVTFTATTIKGTAPDMAGVGITIIMGG